MAGALFCALAAACSGGAGEDRALPAQLDAPAAEAGLAPAAAVLVPADAPTVVFLADSIGAGLHLSLDQAFPAVLQRRLAAEGLPFHLVNASQSGRTSAGGATALAWTLRSKPDLLVIALGGNDGLRGRTTAQLGSLHLGQPRADLRGGNPGPRGVSRAARGVRCRAPP